MSHVRGSWYTTGWQDAGGAARRTPCLLCWRCGQVRGRPRARSRARHARRHSRAHQACGRCAGEGGRSAAAPPLQCQDVPFAGWYGIGRRWEDLAPSHPFGTPWGMRSGHGFAVVGGRLAVFGGEDSAGLKNDVFVSGDGASWMRLHSTSEWQPRTNFLHAVLNETLYVFSGRGCGASATSFCDDVYRASVPSAGSFQLRFEKVGNLGRPGRQLGLAVPLQGRIYDIGGCSGSGCFVDIYALEPDSGSWQAVQVEEGQSVWWTADIVGRWPDTQAYRLVGAAHSDSIFVFGGQVSTYALRLTPSSDAWWNMKLSVLGTVGSTNEIKRAFALSFVSTLWLATGLEDNGAGTNNLFYADGAGGSWSRQDVDGSDFAGRLHGGVVFKNRLCLLLGDGVGTASRYMRVRMPFAKVP
jgi:hypothetical protein